MWMMQEGKIIGLDLKVISCQFWEMENKQNKKKIFDENKILWTMALDHLRVWWFTLYFWV